VGIVAGAALPAPVDATFDIDASTVTIEDSISPLII
jgi:hypothetical protein